MRFRWRVGLLGLSATFACERQPAIQAKAPGAALVLSSPAATAEAPSCQPGGPGLSDCGPARESCCVSEAAQGGTYYRTYRDDGHGAMDLADPATVSGFRLDKYLVTVGRFRQFVRAWKQGWLPAAGSGKHGHLHGGNGLSVAGGGYEPGWVAADDGNVAPTDANLVCKVPYSTWTSTAGTQENLPIDCVNWQEAYAFCIWDGGFLPSEAEWEYAAAGGSEQRAYPWGPTHPGTGSQYAVYACYYPSGAGTCKGLANIAPVGTSAAGAGRWGQLDLAGDVWEWNLDWYAAYAGPSTDGAHLEASLFRVFRGGNFNSGTSYLRPPYRFYYPPTFREYGVGLRCARGP